MQRKWLANPAISLDQAISEASVTMPLSLVRFGYVKLGLAKFG